jgi:hypothetical protein
VSEQGAKDASYETGDDWDEHGVSSSSLRRFLEVRRSSSSSGERGTYASKVVKR